jgi:PTS system nitrogen regulatory IIA component
MEAKRMPRERGEGPAERDEIMTLSEIARYLKVSEKTILRMAKEGDIPGAKVSSQWRFVRAVVDDWLTQKMQSVPKDDLVRVVRGSTEKVIPITRLVSEDRIVMDIEPAAKEAVVRRLVEPVSAARIVEDAELLVAKILAREEMMSTAVVPGIALPHARDPEEIGARETSVVLGVCREGTDFGALDGGRTHLLALVCARSTELHLRVMAKLSLLFRRPRLIDEVRSAGTPADIMGLLIETDLEMFARY